MTYTITTTHESATKTERLTERGLTAEQVQEIKDASKWAADLGDTVTHQVTEDR